MPSVKIRKDDTVEVIAGKDKGKRGRVVRVYPAKGSLMVEHVNVVKRHERLRVGKGRSGTEGGIINKEMPVDMSNVLVVCGNCDKGRRIGFEVSDDGVKKRVCRKCGSDI